MPLTDLSICMLFYLALDLSPFFFHYYYCCYDILVHSLSCFGVGASFCPLEIVQIFMKFTQAGERAALEFHTQSQTLRPCPAD